MTVAERMRKHRARRALRRAMQRADRLGVDLVDELALHLGLKGTDRLVVKRAGGVTQTRYGGAA